MLYQYLRSEQLQFLILVFLFFNFHKYFVLLPDLTLWARKSTHYLRHEITELSSKSKLGDTANHPEKMEYDTGTYTSISCESSIRLVFCRPYWQRETWLWPQSWSRGIKGNQLFFIPDHPSGKGIGWTISSPFSIHVYLIESQNHSYFLQTSIFSFS